MRFLGPRADAAGELLTFASVATRTNDGSLDISAAPACVWTINTAGQTVTVTGEASGASHSTVIVFANSAPDAVTWAGVDTWVGGSEPTMVDGLVVSIFSVGTTVYGAAGLTAAELLTLIKTVDGTGSGLDADTVDGSEASALLDRANHTGTQTASTVSDFDTAVAANSAVAANTAKTTNATHTGDVTGATALTIGADKVTVGMIADARLKAVAGLTMAADKIIYWTGATAAAATDLTTVARTLLGRSTVALMRTDLEVSRFTSGAGAPSSTPTAKGNWYFDTTNNVPYVAVGTASSADWRRSVTRRSATAQSGTTYTLAATDELTTVRCTNSSQVTVTIPTNASVALPVGFRCQLFSTGAGGLTLSTSGITLATGVKKTVAQAQGLYLEKWDTDSWIVVGGTST